MLWGTKRSAPAALYSSPPGRRSPREDAEAGSEIGSALGDVAAAVLDAGHIDPVAGTPELRAALEALRALSPGIDRPPRGFPTPPGSQAASRREMGHRDTPPAATGGELGQPVSRREPHDIPAEYGGVIGAVQDWAREGTLSVNTGRLYRLINRIAATRAEASALAGLAGDPSRAEAVAEMAQSLALATDALQSDVLGLASLPLSTLTGPLPQLVTYLAKKLGKNVDFHVSGDAGLVVDRQVLESIAEPVRQLIVNAIYHGLELPAKRKAERKPATGSISLAVSLGRQHARARRRRRRCRVQLAQDPRGGRRARPDRSRTRRWSPKRSSRCCSGRGSRPEP